MDVLLIQLQVYKVFLEGCNIDYVLLTVAHLHDMLMFYVPVVFIR